MHKALVAPLAEAVPPKFYGGMVSWLRRTRPATASSHFVRELRLENYREPCRLRAASLDTCRNSRSRCRYPQHVFALAFASMCIAARPAYEFS
jgi:hypothetical protein